MVTIAADAETDGQQCCERWSPVLGILIWQENFLLTFDMRHYVLDLVHRKMKENTCRTKS